MINEPYIPRTITVHLGTPSSNAENLTDILGEVVFFFNFSFLEKLKNTNIKNVQSGSFGANMEVNVVNDGPVTIIYEL